MEYKVYKFDELTPASKEQAINDYIKFELETVNYDKLQDGDYLKQAIDKAEEMQTPWFTASYVYEYGKEEIIENIKLNDYNFTVNGKIFS